jgi:hypothetical protein
VIKPLRLSSLAWLAALLGALAFVVWLDAARIRNLAVVNAQGESAPAARPSAAAPELAAGNSLIVPEQNAAAYHWMAQTQRMFLRDEGRVRHVDYENAPDGRAVPASSPYRWWLGLVAWSDHVRTGRGPAESVEHAALFADPLLHVLLLLGSAFFVAWRFGAFPAALAAIGGAVLFPLATEFLPGVPGDRGLATILGAGSVLLLASGTTAKAPRRWFMLAGVSGGLGLWLNVSLQGPVLGGGAAGALLSGWIARDRVLPWRAWAIAGAVTTVLAYLAEFAPAHLWDWQLGVIHPLHAVAWLGAGELLAQVTVALRAKQFPRTPRSLGFIVLALLALAALPAAIWKFHGADFFVPDAAAARLTRLPEGAVAPNLATWIMRGGGGGALWATLLPLGLVVPAVRVLFRRTADPGARAAVALALGPVLVALALACSMLVWWAVLDALLLVSLVVAVGSAPAADVKLSVRLAWGGAFLLVLLPGIAQLQAGAVVKVVLTRSEQLGLIERDLGNWIAQRAEPGGAVVLAPPNETTGLCYYGGLRGIGSLSWENKDGVSAAVRILTAPSAQEAKALVDRRGITHFVLLSWDTAFDDYARAGTGQLEGTFRDQLRFTTLPRWLRPLAYPLPAIGGFEGQSAMVLAVVEEQEEATALARIASYFVEMGDLDQAAAAAQGLRRFPSDLGAWVARAEVEQARGDEAEFAASLKTLQARLSARLAPKLPFDQRVSLAVVLAKAKQEKLAREQVRLALAAADEAGFRALAPGSLYRLLVLARAFDQTVDPALRARALELLPAELRERLR